MFRRMIAPSLALSAALSLASGMAVAQTTMTYTYDDLGRLKTAQTTAGGTMTTGYTYDGADNRTQAKTVNGTSVNSPPTCAAPNTVVINPGMPVQAGTQNYTVNAPCSDPDGDAITITSLSPTASISGSSFTVATTPGMNVLYTVTVSDGKGGTASTNVRLMRN